MQGVLGADRRQGAVRGHDCSFAGLGGHPRGEGVDAAVEFGERRLVGVLPADQAGVRHGPVQGADRAEGFMGAVADGDDEVAGAPDVCERAGRVPGEVEAVPGRGGDGGLRSPLRRDGAGRGRRDAAEARPDGRGQRRAGGVAGAHEHHPLRLQHEAGAGPDGSVIGKPDVVATPVAFGAGAGDDAFSVQHAEMVGEQVRGDAEIGSQLAR